MNDSLNGNSITGAQIYDGGNLTPIAAEDLKGNLVAIKQLINNYNENTKKLDQLEKNLFSVRNELEFQNTYPYVAIFAALANVIGTVLVGVGVNMVTESADEVPLVCMENPAQSDPVVVLIIDPPPSFISTKKQKQAEVTKKHSSLLSI